jgi:hypothetical protein
MNKMIKKSVYIVKRQGEWRNNSATVGDSFIALLEETFLFGMLCLLIRPQGAKKDDIIFKFYNIFT